MILFYKKKASDVILTSIIKHYNPEWFVKKYENNKEVLKIAKMNNTYNFIRVSDYKKAILNKYHTPKWIKNSHRKEFIEKLLCHRKTNSKELINFISKNLFKPENIFEAYTEEVISMKEKVNKIEKEIVVFEQKKKRKIRNGILYLDINPTNNIGGIIADNLAKEYNLPIIILQKNEAFIKHAEQLGFKKNKIKTNRYKALKMKKEIVVEKPVSRKVINTKNTTLLQY